MYIIKNKKIRMKIKSLQIFFLLALFFALPCIALAVATPVPVLNFSDIISGPKTGNTDGAGGLTSSQHGAIVTIWGNYLGSSQGSSQVYYTDSLGVQYPAAHIYYWKNADGNLPSGPADLYTYQKMQEIAFSIPAGAADGAGFISVNVGGVVSTTLPFEIRPGNIRFIKAGGDDTNGDGTWSNSWATINSTVAGGNGKIAAGDLVYSDGVGEVGGVSVGLTAPISGTVADHVSMLAYPGSRVNLSGYQSGQTSPFTVLYDGDNPYWNWSKVSVNTTVSGFSLSKENRIVGVEITGPTVYAGSAGAISGNCNGLAGCTFPEGGEYLGVYIHNYGTDNGVATSGNVGTTSADYPAKLGSTWDTRQHLYYISNSIIVSLIIF